MKRLFCTVVASLALLFQAEGRITVSGYVRDARSGETLIGTMVRDTLSKQSTSTNVYGFYSITLPEGRVAIDYNEVGYAHRTFCMELHRDTVIHVQLEADRQLASAVVTANRSEGSIAAVGMGTVDVPIQQIQHTPALLGETDVVRTLQLLPGVQSGMNGTAGLYVRGGNGDENLFLLDGVPVYKVDHLFGFFSVFTPEAMKKVTFYKSSYPARYGGRLSSVVDVRTKDGDMHHFHGTASIGLLTSRLHLEGPLVKDRTSFSFSARTTYIDWLARPFMSDDSKFSYRFYDLNLKVNHRFSDRDRLYLSLYGGGDQLNQDYKDTEWKGGLNRYGDKMHWGNSIASLRWNHLLSDQLFANITASYNGYRMKLTSYDNTTYRQGEQDNSRSRYHSQITDYNVSIDLEYDPSASHRVLFGGNMTRHFFRPETTIAQINLERDGQVETDTTYRANGRRIRGTEWMAYAEDNITWGRMKLTPGLTLSAFSVDKSTYTRWQPRLSLRYQLSKDWTLKAAYSEMTQYIHLLTSMPIAMPTDLWVPITKRIRPEHARQSSVGAYFTGIEDWELSAETYYKDMRNVLEYRDGMSFMGFSGSWEELVSMGRGQSYGVELMARRTVGRTTGWVAYTWSKSDRKFGRESGVNGGKRFPYTYDRRHNLNVVVNHKVNPHVDVDATWMFHSGEAATVATQYMNELMPDGRVIQGEYVPNRNNYRLPWSHTLCLGVNMHKTLKRGVERTWNISVYNAYNAMNPTIVYRKYSDNGDVIPDKLTKFTLLPCIPSFTLTYKF